MRIYNYLMIGVFTLLLFSCKKYADPSLEDVGYSYFPIYEGEYSIYSVTDTAFEGYDTNTNTTNMTIDNYLVKEEIHAPITVNDEVRYEVYVYYKRSGETWKSYPDSVWTEFNSQRRIIRVRNNIRFVPLVFPIELDKQWDGNISDPESDPQDFYTITSVRRPFSYDNFNYSETATVELVRDVSVINDYLSYEVYANNLGLIYKDDKMYEYQDGGIIYTQAVKGHHIVQKLLVHGRYK
jgi:hypothetical protein